jgi:hypothetical protein
MLVVSVVFLLYSGQPSDLYRLLAVIAGLALGLVLRPTRRVLGWVRSSHHEIRVLMASVVAITAIGPVIALLSATRFGPLAPIGLLFTNNVPTAGEVLDRCQVFHLTRTCVNEITLERINGVGPIIVSVIPLPRISSGSFPSPAPHTWSGRRRVIGRSGFPSPSPSRCRLRSRFCSSSCEGISPC